MIHFRPKSVCVAIGVLTLAGCDYPRVSIDGHTGVPLAQINPAGTSVHDITVLGPDTVDVVHGQNLTIRVEGDARAVSALRFVLADGKLGIGRQPDAVVGNGLATITITAPAIDHLTMAGSGTISSDGLNGPDVGVTIGGAGKVMAAGVTAGQLAVEVLGSGAFIGSGHADKLTLTLAGSGHVDLARLKLGRADIDLAGSGTGDLASDGPVSGSVVGSGTITVHGRAQCTVSVTGPGRVSCRP